MMINSYTPEDNGEAETVADRWVMLMLMDLVDHGLLSPEEACRAKQIYSKKKHQQMGDCCRSSDRVDACGHHQAHPD